MSIEDFVKDIASKGVYLSWSGEKLLCKAEEGALTAEIGQTLKDRKQEIIRFLQMPLHADDVISPRPADKVIPLSYAQQRLWFIDQLEEGSSQYNMPGAIKLKGRLDTEAFKRAITAVVERHEVLRTRFTEIEGNATQTITAEFDFPIVGIDLTNLDEKDWEPELKKRIREEAKTSFDLGNDLMIRVQLIKFSDEDHAVLFNVHHIASDGWSRSILIKEFTALYLAFCQGQPNPLTPLKIQYADYAYWQRNWLQGDQLEEKLSYWREHLAGIPLVHSLPLDYPRPNRQSYKAGNHYQQIDNAVLKQVKAACRDNNVTLFIYLQTVFSILLSSYSNETDIVVGTPTAGRNNKSIEGLIGFFVNTLVLRSDLSSNPRFVDLLQRMKQTILDAYTHEQIPFEMVVEEVNPPRSLGHSPVFQVMMGLQNNEQTESTFEDLTVTAVREERATSQFDLELTIIEKNDGLELSWNYNTDLFHQDTIRRFGDSFFELLNGAVAQPESSIAALPLLPPSEKKILLEQFNNNVVDFPREKTIIDLFEQHVQDHPDRIAMVFGDKQYTYQKLNEEANQLARYMTSTFGPQPLVGVCMERSLDMAVAILASWKVGSAYIPLDPGYPQKRKADILQDANVGLLIVEEEEQRQELQSFEGHFCMLPELREELAKQDKKNPKRAANPDDLAYVIFTSGSTGKPKGAMVEHVGMVNHLFAKINDLQVTEQSVIAQNASHCFDISVWQFFTAIISGGTTVIYSNEKNLQPEEFMAEVREDQITILEVVPSYLGVMLNLLEEQDDSDKVLSGLSYLMVTGEVVKPNLVNRWLDCYPSIPMVNAYGPTEASDDITHHFITEKVTTETVPIGRPVQNMTIYIVGSGMQLCPLGVKGEIVVSGVGVGRGYLNDEEKTRKVFLNDPFVSGEEIRMYKTGDIGRWLPDGTIAFSGRKDTQVKIRGFRIELGEIEHRIGTIDSIVENVVLVKEDQRGQKTLVAFLLVEGEKDDFDTDTVKEALAGQLPDYMIPSHLVVLDKMPLTRNGKTDKKALAAVDIATGSGTDYVAPRNETESKLVDVFSEVLKLEQIGINDNFFELGGDSILSIQIVSRARNAGMIFKVKHIFEHQTIAALAAVVNESESEIIAEQGQVTGEVTLNPIQNWYFEEAFEVEDHWNLSILLNSKKSLTVETFTSALHEIILQHDAFRLRFERLSGDTRQYHADEAGDVVAVIDLHDISEPTAAIEAACEDIQSSLSISEGPLFKIGYIQTPDSDKHNRLLFAIHHLVIDGISWRILLEDLHKAITDIEAEKPVDLGRKSSSFKQYVQSLNTYATSEQLAGELEYWQGVTAMQPKPLTVDFPDGNNLESQAHFVSVQLDREATGQLLKEANSAYHTEINDLLLTALALGLNQWAGGHKFGITLESHGREDIDPHLDILRTVGWFTTRFPVILSTAPRNDLAATLKMVKEALHTIPKHGIGYGVLRYFHPDEEVRDSLIIEEADEIVFNYLGQLDQVLSGSEWFSPAKEDSGSNHAPNNHRPSLLSVNASVYDGQLKVSFGYSADLFKEATIQSLADEYLSALNQLIAHCLLPESSGFTPSDFPLASLTQMELDEYVITSDHLNTLESVYPLTPLQEGIFFHSLYDSKGIAYLEHYSCELEGEMNIASFEQAWLALIERHSVLRSSFIYKGLSAPVQRVSSEAHLPLEVLDYSHLDAATQQAGFKELCELERNTPMNFEQAPLMRLKLVKMMEGRYGFSWTFHHILMDGWSIPIVIRELFEQYHAVNNDQKRSFPADQFEDYVAYLAQQDQSQAQAFWTAYLKGFRSPTPLPFGKSGYKKENQGYREEKVSLSPEWSMKTEQFARQHQLTQSVLVQGAWAMLLAAYSQEEEVLFGVTVSGRPAELVNVEQKVGTFINTIPVLVPIEAEANSLALLKQLRAEQIELLEHQYNALTDIQSWSDISGSDTLFDTIVLYQNFPATERASLEQSDLNIVNTQYVAKNNFALSLVVNMTDRLTVKLIYNAGLYEPDQIKQLLNHYYLLLDKIIAEPELSTDQLDLISEEEKEQLASWQGRIDATGREYTLPERIEQQAALTPNHVAVRHEGNELTFAELNEKANRLAHYLQELGLEQGENVGIYMTRSPELMIGLLGIMKSGATYVPLDPHQQGKRLAYMLRDANIDTVLLQPKLSSSLPLSDIDILVMDETVLEPDWLAEYEPNNPSESGTTYDHSDTAYIIYTSGSTGVPKGVEIPHSGLIDYCTFALNHYYKHRLSGSLVATSHAFDLTIPALYLPLLSGGCVSMLPWDDELSALAHTLAGNSTQSFLLRMTPTHAKALLSLMPDSITVEQYHVFVIGGEQLDTQTANALKNKFPGSDLFNHYGPTETVVGCCIYDINANGEEAIRGFASIPIGKPMDNTNLYVLNTQLQQVPVGVVGELYIGGPCVGKGYVNLPELTAERFISNPFEEEGTSRLYKSGDLVRWQINGNLEFVGRADEQVKVRGYRIEPGEIESRLTAIDSINKSVVLAKSDEAGNKNLVAFVVSNHEEVDGKNIKSILRESLPEHMIPTQITALEALPLTRNGKVDKKALLAMEIAITSDRKYVAPRNETEKQLAIIFAEVLNVEQVGIHDNFFDLGGHSLSAIQLISKINIRFVTNVTLAMIFHSPTIHLIAQTLHEEWVNGVNQDSIATLQPTGAYAPLYLVGGGGGFLIDYHSLVKGLGETCPVYGFHPSGLNEDGNILTTVEEIATHYIGLLDLNQIDGDFNLIGHSFGGWVVFEMARQLELMNVRVNSVFLLDCISPLESKVNEELSESAQHLLALQVTKKNFGWELPFTEEAYVTMSADERLDQFQQLLAGSGVDLSIDQIRRYMQVKLTQSRMNYSPDSGLQETPLILFKAEDTDWPELSATLGWEALCDSPPIVHEVRGTHSSMITPEHNSELITNLKKHIEDPVNESEIPVLI